MIELMSAENQLRIPENIKDNVRIEHASNKNTAYTWIKDFTNPHAIHSTRQESTSVQQPVQPEALKINHV